jgi:hypothetical protein
MNSNFVGCCAWAGKLRAKSKAQIARRQTFFLTVNCRVVIGVLDCRSNAFNRLVPTLHDSHYFMFSFDHLIRSRQHIRRNRQADLFGRFQVDHQLKLRRLLDGDVGGLGSF